MKIILLIISSFVFLSCDWSNGSPNSKVSNHQNIDGHNEIAVYLGTESLSAKEQTILTGGVVRLEESPTYKIRSLVSVKLLVTASDPDASELSTKIKESEVYTPEKWESDSSQLMFELDKQDSEAISKIATENLKRRIAFVRDDVVLFAPIIASPLSPANGKQGLQMGIDLGHLDISKKLALATALEKLVK